MSDLVSNQRVATETDAWLNDAPAAVLNATIEQAGEFHALLNPELHLIWASDSVHTVLGYAPDVFLARPTTTLIHSDDQQSCMAQLHDLVEDLGGRRRIEYRIRHADGSWRWVETVMNNLLDRPDVGGLISTTRDITGRMLAKDRLAISERRLRSVVSGAGDMVVIVDTDRKVDYVTPNVAALLKRSTSAVRDHWASFLHPDDLAVLDSHYQAALLDSGIAQGPFDLRALCSDGSWLVVEAMITDYEADPVVRGVVLNARDVTARRRIEEEQSRDQVMFNDLVEMAPVGIFLADASGDWTYANARATKVFGVDSRTLLGKGWTERIDAADVVRLRSELARWDGEGRYVTELRTRNSPDARELKITISRPESSGAVGTIEDATSRRDLDEMLIDGAALGSLTEVVGGAAHDIHNLLSSIGFQLGLLDQQGTLDQPEATERVVAVTAAVDRACDITEDLMAMSRPTRTTVGVLEVGPLVESLAGMLGVLVEHQADLVVDNRGDGLAAIADRSGLERVITNLVVNALDAVESRGRITIGVSEVRFDAESAPNNGPAGYYVAIDVTDDGCGIPVSAMSEIFEPYFTTKADGNGIGLSASRRNVRAWGGEIVVKSTERIGTTVTVLLPAESTIG